MHTDMDENHESANAKRGEMDKGRNKNWVYDHFNEVQLLNNSIDNSKPTQESSSQNPIQLKEGSTLDLIGQYRAPVHFILD